MYWIYGFTFYLWQRWVYMRTHANMCLKGSFYSANKIFLKRFHINKLLSSVISCLSSESLILYAKVNLMMAVPALLWSIGEPNVQGCQLVLHLLRVLFVAALQLPATHSRPEEILPSPTVVLDSRDGPHVAAGQEWRRHDQHSVRDGNKGVYSPCG